MVGGVPMATKGGLATGGDGPSTEAMVEGNQRWVAVGDYRGNLIFS